MAEIPDEAINRMNDLTPGAWRLFCFLCLCRNRETGRAFPSISTCSEAADTHQKNIFRLRKELSDHNFCSFDGNETTFHFSFKSSKNATTDKAGKDVAGDDAKSSKFATQSSENATELQKCYPKVAKTLPESSKFATAYKEQPEKEVVEEASAPPPDLISALDNFHDPESEMALAIASVIGLPSLPEGKSSERFFEMARLFISAGIQSDAIPQFERDWYKRKNDQGKRYQLTLKILQDDLPGWVRANRMQAGAQNGKSSTVRTIAALPESLRPWANKPFDEMPKHIQDNFTKGRRYE